MTDTVHCYRCGKLSLLLHKRILFRSKDDKVTSVRTVYVCDDCRREVNENTETLPKSTARLLSA